MSEAKNTGDWGEEQAVNYLKNQNYIILETNWRFKKLEVDIIAQTGNYIVFVEVKTRGSDEFGEPETFVSLKKQRFIVEAANNYIISNNISLEARFDIVSILFNNKRFVINHLPDAFYPMVK